MAPMSKVHRKALDSALKELCVDLDVPQISIHLISAFILSDEDQERLDATPTRTEKVRVLFGMLKMKGDKAWEALLNGLRETQDFLVEILEKHASDASDLAQAGSENEVANIIEAGQIINANSLVSDQDLNKIAKGLGDEWKNVGKALGLTQQQLYQCEADNPLSVHDKIFDMLHKWKRKNKRDANRHALVNGLAKIGEVVPEAYDFMLEY